MTTPMTIQMTKPRLTGLRMRCSLRAGFPGTGYGQLPMSLSDEATMTSTLARPTTLTFTWTALTVRPSSGVENGICSLSFRDTTPTLIPVFGAMLVGEAITTVLPTFR